MAKHGYFTDCLFDDGQRAKVEIRTFDQDAAREQVAKGGLMREGGVELSLDKTISRLRQMAIVRVTFGIEYRVEDSSAGITFRYKPPDEPF